MREGNRLEAKRAKGGLPHSLWETYSSFANTEGGLILLGVSEHEDHSLYITGVDDARKMVQDFWNTVHDSSKVSAVVLSDNDVVIRHTSQGDVISIDIPRAAREHLPVYVGSNPMKGSYRRNGDGDYLCDGETVHAMLRDSDLLPLDRAIVEDMGVDALNADSVASYRRQFKSRRSDHPWVGLSDEDFLLRIEALRLDGSQVRPTRAGLLMFGEAWRITSEFPYWIIVRLWAIGTGGMTVSPRRMALGRGICMIFGEGWSTACGPLSLIHFGLVPIYIESMTIRWTKPFVRLLPMRLSMLIISFVGVR